MAKRDKTDVERIKYDRRNLKVYPDCPGIGTPGYGCSFPRHELQKLATAIQDGADRILIEKRSDGKWMVVASNQNNSMYHMILVGSENCTLFMEIFDFCKDNSLQIHVNQGHISPSGLMLGLHGEGKGFN